jgi:hypothetical protein
MSLSGVSRWGGLLLLVLTACARTPSLAQPIDAGPAASIQTPVVIVVIDAGPQALPGARLVALTDPPDGGELELSLPDASVPAAAELRFETTACLDDVRLRVLTADDRLVDNRASLTVDDGGTRAVLKPLRAWPSRGCCTFRVDGEVNRLPSAGTTTYLPFELPFVAEPDPNAPPIGHHFNHHHRRHPR